jgi:hypothetical protein
VVLGWDWDAAWVWVVEPVPVVELAWELDVVSV